MYVAIVQINHNLRTHQPEIICVTHAEKPSNASAHAVTLCNTTKIKLVAVVPIKEA